jgi:hypothetical protein
LDFPGGNSKEKLENVRLVTGFEPGPRRTRAKHLTTALVDTIWQEQERKVDA